MKFGKTFVALTTSLLLVSSCASGKARYASDRIEARKSSLRVRPKTAAKPTAVNAPLAEGRGRLTPKQHAALKAKVRSWIWPTTEVHITSRFGHRSGDHHDGIDLRAPTGTPVLAAAPGKVIYADQKIRGYGKMIVIKHDSRLSTVYAHNSKLYVKRGQQVRRGQKIALSGSTGRSTGPHVHFEIREGVTAINPAALLPSPAVIREVNRRIANRSGGSSYRVKTTQSKAANPSEASSKRRPSKRYRQYSTEGKSKRNVRMTQSSAVRAKQKPKTRVAARPAARPAARLASGDGFTPKKHRPTPTTTPGAGE